MNKNITNLVVAVVATFTLSAVANAQQQTFAQQDQSQRVQTQVLPYYVSPPQVQPPQPQNQYYFGMRLELNRNYSGTTLRIVDVTWGSPAQRAGLEVGDEIRTINGRGFQYANDSFDAVAMMNRFVEFGSGSAPAVAAAMPQGAQAYYVAPPAPQPIARMVVRNVRNGQNVYINVIPEPRVFGGPAPAAAASAVVAVR